MECINVSANVNTRNFDSILAVPWLMPRNAAQPVFGYRVEVSYTILPYIYRDPEEGAAAHKLQSFQLRLCWSSLTKFLSKNSEQQLVYLSNIIAIYAEVECLSK